MWQVPHAYINHPLLTHLFDIILQNKVLGVGISVTHSAVKTDADNLVGFPAIFPSSFNIPLTPLSSKDSIDSSWFPYHRAFKYMFIITLICLVIFFPDLFLACLVLS